MRLLVITSSWPRFDGDYAGHFVREWVESVGYPATVLVPADDEPRVARSSSASIHVVEVPYARRPRLFYGGGVLANLRRSPLVATQIPRAFLALFEAALDYAREADVIVSHWLLPAGLIGAVVSRLSRRPHVAVSHGSDRFLVGGIPFVGAQLLARSVCIPMGVPLAEPPPPPTSFSRVAYVGRFEHEKGLDVLERAAAMLPWLSVSVAGQGSVLPPPRAHHLGVIPTHDVSRFIAHHDGCVLPSRRDGAPRFLLEAMMAARPIVATRVGRVPELARDGVDALLVPPGSPKALADALCHLRDDAALRVRLAASAHERARAFAWPRIAARYRRILQDAAA